MRLRTVGIFLVASALIAGLAACTPASVPHMSITITPDPAETKTYGLFETSRVRCSIVLPDGTSDTDCSRFPDPPRWTVSQGEVERVDGCMIYWNTGHVSFETDATITVQYGGATTGVDLTLHSLEGDVTPGFWTYPCLSPPSEQEMIAYSHIHLLPHNEEKRG